MMVPLRLYRLKPKQAEARQWFPPGHKQHDPTAFEIVDMTRLGSNVATKNRRTGVVYAANGPTFYVCLLQGAFGHSRLLGAGHWVVKPDDKEACLVLTDEEFQDAYEAFFVGADPGTDSPPNPV